MTEPMGYLIPLTKKDERSFAGGVTLSNSVSGSLHDLLCIYFPKANIQRINDTDDLKEKFDHEVKKVKKANKENGLRLEEDMWTMLSELKMYTLSEVEKWLGFEANGDNCQNSDEEEKTLKKVNENILETTKTSKFQDEKDVVVDKKEAEPVVGVKIKEMVYTLDEQFLEECLETLDLENVEQNMTRNEFVRLGLKLLPVLICENGNLKEQLKNAHDTIANMRKEDFNRNTREITMKGELETLKKKQADYLKIQQSTTLINKVMQKLEGIEKCQKENQTVDEKFHQEMTEKMDYLKTNDDKIVNILGGIKIDVQKERRTVSCKSKVAQEIENSKKTVTFYGSQASLTYFENICGDLGRDVESLKKRKLVAVEVTDKEGVENLLQLVQKVDEKRSLAIIVLNVAAETAEIFLKDEAYLDRAASLLKMAVETLVTCATKNFEQITFILPPHTPQSYIFIDKLSKILSEVDVINISELQFEMGKNCVEDQTWKIGNKNSLKKFVITDDEVMDGWNSFSFYAMITQVAGRMAGDNSMSDCCLECGLGHDKISQCETGAESREEIKSESSTRYNRAPTSGYSSGRNQNQDLAETCLKCFRSHNEASCFVKEDLMCNFQGCFRKGHQRVVHFPKKQETVERLRAKYGPSFAVVPPDSKKRYGGRDFSHEAKKRSKEEK